MCGCCFLRRGSSSILAPCTSNQAQGITERSRRTPKGVRALRRSCSLVALTFTSGAMTLVPHLARVASLLLGTVAFSLAFATTSNQPEALPRDAERKVVGIWKLRDPSCTRAIEQIFDRFFIVARCREPADIDGSIGIPLSRVSHNSFQNLSGVTYEIQKDGHLLVKVGDEVFDRGAPHKNLWPE
jgi:hypothetical protein